MRILEEMDMVKEQASTLILGVAVIEDIIIISILAILQSITSTGVGQVSVGELVISILSVLAFIGGVLYIGSRNSTKVC